MQKSISFVCLHLQMLVIFFRDYLGFQASMGKYLIIHDFLLTITEKFCGS